MRNGIIFRATFITLISLLSFAANAAQYELADGCKLRKYEDGKWRSADSSVLEDSSIKKLQPKGDKVRFKLDGVWYSTNEGCLVSKDGASEEVDDEPTDEDSPKRSRNRRASRSTFPRSSFQLYALTGGFLSTGEGEKVQLAFGGGLKAQLGESFAIKAQYTTSSRTITNSQTVDISTTLSRREIMLIPNLTVGNLYFGPQLGLATLGISIEAQGQSASESKSIFAFGANLGFTMPLSENFSIGPDFLYTHFPEFDAIESAHIFKLFLGMNIIF